MRKIVPYRNYAQNAVFTSRICIKNLLVSCSIKNRDSLK